MEGVGKARNDAAMLLVGRILGGIIWFHSGEFVTSRVVFEQCYAMNNPATRAACATVMPEDPHAVILSLLSPHLGHIDAARSRAEEVLSEASQVGHVYQLAWASNWACWTECAVGSPYDLRRHAEQLVCLSSEHGFPNLLAWGLIYRGWSMVSLAEPEKGRGLITRGLSMHRDTGSVTSIAFALTLLADACGRLELATEGLNYLVEAERIIETSNDRYHEAELHRVRGDLLNATGDQVAAEDSYHQALVVARRQSARIFELHVATSLARLWRDQGKRAEARDLLAPIYGWFTEGFDTPVLKEAKALLDELPP